MSTPRKRYFRVPDSILREPHDREEKLALVLLMAWLNTRWARDGIPNDQAGRAMLSGGAIEDITGRKRIRSGFALLAKLALSAGFTVSLENELVLIDWPNFADFQRFKSEFGAESGAQLRAAKRPLRTPPPYSASGEELKNPSLSPLAARPRAEAPPPQREKAPKKTAGTHAPEALAEESIQALEKWTRENLPSELAQVRAHIDACLDHFRAKGQPMVDWVATCRNWIRRSPEMRRPGQRAPITTPARKQTREELIETAKRLRAVEYDRRLHGEL